MRDHYRRPDAAWLIPALINSDAEAFGNQFPGYRAEFASALAELESILKQVDERGP